MQLRILLSSTFRDKATELIVKLGEMVNQNVEGFPWQRVKQADKAISSVLPFYSCASVIVQSNHGNMTGVGVKKLSAYGDARKREREEHFDSTLL